MPSTLPTHRPSACRPAASRPAPSARSPALWVRALATSTASAALASFRQESKSRSSNTRKYSRRASSGGCAPFCLCFCFSNCHSERSERTCFLPFLLLLFFLSSSQGICFSPNPPRLPGGPSSAFFAKGGVSRKARPLLPFLLPSPTLGVAHSCALFAHEWGTPKAQPAPCFSSSRGESAVLRPKARAIPAWGAAPRMPYRRTRGLKARSIDLRPGYCVTGFPAQYPSRAVTANPAYPGVFNSNT